MTKMKTNEESGDNGSLEGANLSGDVDMIIISQNDK